LVAAVATLALGIAASTAVFSVVYGVLLKLPAARETERMVHRLHSIDAATPRAGMQRRLNAE
jgi:hypothetical protein